MSNNIPPMSFEKPEQPAPGDTTYAVLSHLLGIIGVVIGYGVLGFLGPLLIMLIKGPTDEFTRRHAVESLNFQISVTIAAIVGLITVFILIGFVILLVTFVCALVFSIQGAVAASKGQEYLYPLNLRLVK